MHTFRYLILLIIFGIYTRCKGSSTQRLCTGYFQGCCPGSIWSSDQKYCEPCKPGYTGKNCSYMCPYPSYGEECQNLCSCSKDLCNVSTGCQHNSTENVTRFGDSSHAVETSTRLAENATRFGDRSHAVENSTRIAEKSCTVHNRLNKPGNNDIFLIFIILIGCVDLVLFCFYCAWYLYERKTIQTADTDIFVPGNNRVYENIEINYLAA